MSNTKQNDSSRSERPGAGRIQPLKLALPFVKPYTGRLLLAFVCLTIASISMLGMPVAIRYVIDYGFSGDNLKSIDLYFMALLGLALVYAVFASFRYYLVMWIGERVVADIRSAVYRHVIKLSPTFF